MLAPPPRQPAGCRLDHPALTALHSYWMRKRNGAFAPSRSDIDPVEIPSLLPHVLLLDVIDGGARFRYRLAGTEIEERIGCRLAGRYLDEVTEGDYSSYIHALFRRSLTERRPLYSECVYGLSDKLAHLTKRIMLPLSADGRAIDMFLCGQIVHRPAKGEHRTLVRMQRHMTAQPHQHEMLL